MTYRDDKGALQAKVGELQARLDEAHREIETLRGSSDVSVTRTGETLGATSGLGTPSSLRIEEVIDGTLTTEGYEAIAALLEKRLGITSRQVGSKLETNALPQVGGKVTITVRDQKTHVVLEQDWSTRALGTWILAGVVGAFGAFAAAAVMHDAMHLTDAMTFVQMLWAGPLIGGSVAVPVRARARKQVERELAERRGTFAALVDVARSHLSPKPRARVAIDEDASDAEERAEAEAQQHATRAPSTD